MSNFSTVAERPLPFAQDAEPGIYLADPSRRLKAFLLEEAVYVVAFVVIAIFAGVNISLAVTSVLWLALQVNAGRQKSGTSFAKKRMNMRVVDAKTFEPLTLSQMIIRRGLLATLVGHAGLAIVIAAPTVILNAIGLEANGGCNRS